MTDLRDEDDGDDDNDGIRGWPELGVNGSGIGGAMPLHEAPIWFVSGDEDTAAVWGIVTKVISEGVLVSGVATVADGAVRAEEEEEESPRVSFALFLDEEADRMEEEEEEATVDRLAVVAGKEVVIESAIAVGRGDEASVVEGRGENGCKRVSSSRILESGGEVKEMG